MAAPRSTEAWPCHPRCAANALDAFHYRTVTTQETPLHDHDGGPPGLNAMFGRFPKENAVVVIFCNRDEQARKVGSRIVADFFKE